MQSYLVEITHFDSILVISFVDVLYHSAPLSTNLIDIVHAKNVRNISLFIFSSESTFSCLLFDIFCCDDRI